VNVRAIPRIAVDSYLKLVRLPLDTAVGLLPGNGDGPGPAAALALDRADATVRAVIATVLGDVELGEEGDRRRQAAVEREEALRLRGTAQRETEEADAKRSARHQRAAEQRERATRRAGAQRQQVSRKREERSRQAKKVERQRRGVNRKATARTEEAIDAEARKARLDAVETKAAALQEEEQALTAADEASRLGEAAARAKAERKTT